MQVVNDVDLKANMLCSRVLVSLMHYTKYAMFELGERTSSEFKFVVNEKYIRSPKKKTVCAFHCDH